MEIEREKALHALSRQLNLKHSYEVVVSGIGRENTAKAMMQLPEHDLSLIHI
jgi:hypothetical protein